MSSRSALVRQSLAHLAKSIDLTVSGQQLKSLEYLECNVQRYVKQRGFASTAHTLSADDDNSKLLTANPSTNTDAQQTKQTSRTGTSASKRESLAVRGTWQEAIDSWRSGCGALQLSYSMLL
jgi:hypothetical protein